MVGTALVAGGASALNMYLERTLDSKMRRTDQRPLPAGRLQSREALLFAVVISFVGMIYLFVLVNPLASLISAVTLISYLFFYTPLKTKTWLCTLIGAAPGAFPPMIGWAAAAGEISTGAWILFVILFLWQVPHFYAIGWIYREDYARAGFPMLPVVDPSGSRTSRQAGLYILALLLVTLLPTFTGLAGSVYLVGAILLGVLFLYQGIVFARARDKKSAHRLFIASIVYLPILLALLMIDKA
jgi:protoheme IX farnesyltransferase